MAYFYLICNLNTEAMVFQYNGQSAQDYFVLYATKFKRNGIFLEIGSNDPIKINNTYLLERDYGWSGYMVESQQDFIIPYKTHRPNSTHIMQDATMINFTFIATVVDYLQIDLEVSNKSTLEVLQHLDTQVMDTTKFATITFEHDIYTGDWFDTRAISREILARRGYIRVFSDVMNSNCPYEDWYVHPELVDMSLFDKNLTRDHLDYKDIISVW
jgi:hypothetical protein